MRTTVMGRTYGLATLEGTQGADHPCLEQTGLAPSARLQRTQPALQIARPLRPSTLSTEPRRPCGLATSHAARNLARVFGGTTSSCVSQEAMPHDGPHHDNGATLLSVKLANPTSCSEQVGAFSHSDPPAAAARRPPSEFGQLHDLVRRLTGSVYNK